MSKNTILPNGMYWHYNPVSKELNIIVEDSCEYQNIRIDKKINSETSHNSSSKKDCLHCYYNNSPLNENPCNVCFVFSHFKERSPS